MVGKCGGAGAPSPSKCQKKRQQRGRLKAGFTPVCWSVFTLVATFSCNRSCSYGLIYLVLRIWWWCASLSVACLRNSFLTKVQPGRVVPTQKRHQINSSNSSTVSSFFFFCTWGLKNCSHIWRNLPVWKQRSDFPLALNTLTILMYGNGKLLRRAVM